MTAKSVYDNYKCEGQLTMTDYLAQQIERKKVKDLTAWINSQGKCQFDQIGDVIRQSKILDDEDDIYVLTNKVSVYVLNMSLGYMEYLREEAQ